jgi:hypothetical protein
MTQATLAAPAMTTEQRQEAAVDAWLDSEGTLTAADLAERFDRSERWSRDRIAEGRERQRKAAARPAPVAVVATPAATPPPVAATPAAPVATPVTPAATRQPRHWADTATVLVVAIVAAAASYGHMLEVASMAGEPLWLARAFPITVDGLALAALRRGDEGRRWLALALVVSVAGNVLAQFPEAAATAGPVVSAWPPLALYGTHRLLHGRV